MRDKIRRLIALMALLLATVWAVRWLPEIHKRWKEQQQYEALAGECLEEVETKEWSLVSDSGAETSSTVEGPAPFIQKEPTEVLTQSETTTANFDVLLAQNPDTVAWLQVKGTGINYPVVQAEDNQVYLQRSFTGANSIAGTLFLDCDNASNFSDGNSIIHGHNMFDSSTNMFSSLVRYKDYDFWENNQIIYLSTPQGEMEFHIFAVCQFDITSPTVNNYYKQDFRSKEFQSEYVQNLQNNSIINTGVSVPVGCKLLTLSTCDRSLYGDNGRIVVVAFLKC